MTEHYKEKGFFILETAFLLSNISEKLKLSIKNDDEDHEMKLAFFYTMINSNLFKHCLIFPFHFVILIVVIGNQKIQIGQILKIASFRKIPGLQYTSLLFRFFSTGSLL